MDVTSTTRARIETGGGGVVAHVGLHALGRFADALGLGAALSDSTLYRTYRQIDAATLAGLWDAMAEVRADVWSAVDMGERVVLDIDASLVEIHSEHKHGTAPTYKAGFGFHRVS